MNYDYIIIGGGISGLYCAKRLVDQYKNMKKILLLDERSYYGGRLITNKQPHYEIGAARFNDNHKLLIKLIEKYNLTKIELSSALDFISKINNDVTYYKDANETFQSIMTNIIKNSKKFTKKKLITMSTKQFIDIISQTPELSKKLINIFGYNSEFTKMNAYDSLRSFENDFISKKFYVLQNGFSELCNNIVDENKKLLILNYIIMLLI